MAETSLRRLDGILDRASVVIVVALVLASLVALGQGDAPRPGAGSLPVSERSELPIPLGSSTITGLDVPRLSLSTTNTVGLGLRDDNSLEVPADATTVGWYQRSADPGTVGPSVFAAHVNYRGVQGAFARLGDMKPGDVIEVHRADESTAVFAVDRVGQFSKDAFPTDSVYAPTPDGEIRLITCGGVFNPTTRSYEDNIVVYGRLVSAYRPA